jgi:hypothetical protein
MLHRARNALGVVAVAAVAAAARVVTPGAGAASSHKPRTVAFTQTSTGTTVMQDDGSLLVLGAGTSSPGGDYAFASRGRLNGNSITTTGTLYHADGAGTFEETDTIGAPDANGVIAITGSGKCTGHGTGVHKNNYEKCSYTLTGTSHPEGSVFVFTANVRGTYTR